MKRFVGIFGLSMALPGCQPSPHAALEEAVRAQSAYPDSVEITSAYQGYKNDDVDWLCGTFDSVDADAKMITDGQVMFNRKTGKADIWQLSKAGFWNGDPINKGVLVTSVPVCDLMNDFGLAD